MFSAGAPDAAPSCGHQLYELLANVRRVTHTGPHTLSVNLLPRRAIVALAMRLSGRPDTTRSA